MPIPNLFLEVEEVFWWFPCIAFVAVAFPFDKILDFTVFDYGIQYAFCHEFVALVPGFYLVVEFGVLWCWFQQ